MTVACEVCCPFGMGKYYKVTMSGVSPREFSPCVGNAADCGNYNDEEGFILPHTGEDGCHFRLFFDPDEYPPFGFICQWDNMQLAFDLDNNLSVTLHSAQSGGSLEAPVWELEGANCLADVLHPVLNTVVSEEVYCNWPEEITVEPIGYELADYNPNDFACWPTLATCGAGAGVLGSLGAIGAAAAPAGSSDRGLASGLFAIGARSLLSPFTGIYPSMPGIVPVTPEPPCCPDDNDGLCRCGDPCGDVPVCG